MAHALAKRGTEKCDICIAAGYTGEGFRGRLNRKLLHSEHIENVSPEHKQEPDNTNLEQTSCRVAANQFAAASVVTGLTGAVRSQAKVTSSSGLGTSIPPTTAGQGLRAKLSQS